MKKSSSNKKNDKTKWSEIGKTIGAKIDEECKEDKCSSWNIKNNVSCGCGGAFYFLGFIGAAVYYISTAPDIWMAMLGFLKALVWPAFLVYEVLVFIGMAAI